MLDAINEFETNYNAYVYHIIYTSSAFGNLFSMLYVSSHKEEWQSDREDLENKQLFAYVWNKDENFDFFCNMEMVELSLIEDTSDNKELHRLIARHYEFTESPLALRMLENWEEYVQQFIKVMPIEYKKVMNEEKMKLLQQKIANVERDY